MALRHFVARRLVQQSCAAFGWRRRHGRRQVRQGHIVIIINDDDDDDGGGDDYDDDDDETNCSVECVIVDGAEQRRSEATPQRQRR